MYRTISTSIPSGQNDAPVVEVPGRLIGVAANLGATSTDLLVLIMTPVGRSDVYVAAGQVRIANQVNFKYLVMPPGMPVGATSYTIWRPTVAAYATPVMLYYEDSPAIYS